MSQPAQPPRPSLDIRGAVDLGALAARRTAAAAPPSESAAGGGAYVIDTTDATFVEEVVQVSATVPVVLDFWATWCAPCRQLSPVLESLAAEFDGRILLAKVDADANPQLTQAFGVKSIPAVFAVLKGQPVPLFEGAQPQQQIRAVLAELLRVAEANGVTGRLKGPDGDGAQESELAEPVEEPLPPLHQAAYDAIERDDLDAAAAAYEQALLEAPADEDARIGLAQVRLLQRTRDVDAVAARDAAAADPRDVGAQLLAADLDMLGGHVEDAFGRLVDTVRITAEQERNLARVRLVEFFDIVGTGDPRVARARVALANALF